MTIKSASARRNRKRIGDIRRILMFHVHNLYSRVFCLLTISTRGSMSLGISCDRCHCIECVMCTIVRERSRISESRSKVT